VFYACINILNEIMIFIKIENENENNYLHFSHNILDIIIFFLYCFINIIINK